jgi:hypothetical protein
MSLEQWAKNGWLRSHVERDLEDAQRNISADWSFGIAYNAALKLCTILLHASGYRPEQKLGHHRTLTALALILGESRNADADYLDACRAKRNTVEYDTAGAATAGDARELVEFAKQLREEVIAWLKKNHAELC